MGKSSVALALTLFVEENIYPQANTFIPERWYLYPDMVKEKSAWAPFSTGTSRSARLADLRLTLFIGPYGCIGRPLAMMDLRTTVARLVMNFDISFPPGDVDRGRTFEAKTIEHFTLAPAELKICLQKRLLQNDYGNE